MVGRTAESLMEATGHSKETDWAGGENLIWIEKHVTVTKTHMIYRSKAPNLRKIYFKIQKRIGII